MSDRRQLRREGESVLLGGISYRIDFVEGMGGSSIVYRASYEDALNHDRRHEVLIKELFPWHPGGTVYRDGDGWIRCTPEGRGLMEHGRLSFRQGNQINLELLARMPSQISGNVNSFEAYGTYYSVLSVHGGENLETALEEGTGPRKLRDMALVLEKVLDALACFHRNGFLHLDISPDNILLLPEQALLIDYSSVWDIQEGNFEEFTFSEKEGYSAPEISLGSIGEIGFSTDLYAVCAIFFRMLAGRSLTGDDVAGNRLGRCLMHGLPVFEGEPESAVGKTIQILLKGLHILPRKRYQSTDELKAELEELLDRIDRMGVSHAALWEAGRADFKRQKGPAARFLPRKILLGMEDSAGADMEAALEAVSESQDTLSEAELLDRLGEGALFLLEGAGGIGKTWLLHRLWESGTKGYTLRTAAVLYISLKEYQGAGEEPAYIRKSVLGKLGARRGRNEIRQMLRELEQLFASQADGRAKVILLLDGLNEAGDRRRLLLKEIEDLGAMPGVSILVTDRTAEVKKYALKKFRTAKLLPLAEELVREELECAGFEFPENVRLRELLTNPMMLFLYRDVLLMQRESHDDSGAEERITTEVSLTGLYLDRLCQVQLRLYSGDEAQQLRCRYILEHLLPDIAAEMSKRNRTMLEPERLYAVTEKSYRNLRKKAFGKTFPDYIGKSRLMLRDISDANEWFDFAVTEQLESRLGLLVKSGNGSYGLLHDNFLEYLTAVAEKNQHIYSGRRRRVWTVRGTAAAAAAVFAAAGSAAVYSHVRDRTVFRVKDERLIGEAVSCLKNNLEVLSSIIVAQKTMVDMVYQADMLEHSENGLRSYSLTRSQFENTNAADDREALSQNVRDALLRANPDYPMEYADYLYNEPVNIEVITSKVYLWFDQVLYDMQDTLASQEEKKKIMDVYDQYLEAYAEYIFYITDYTLLCISPEAAEMILDGHSYHWAVDVYYMKTSMSGQEPQHVRDLIRDAGVRLREAENTMNEYGYAISWGEIL